MLKLKTEQPARNVQYWSGSHSDVGYSMLDIGHSLLPPVRPSALNRPASHDFDDITAPVSCILRPWQSCAFQRPEWPNDRASGSSHSGPHR
jgi:hypothetical protein